MRQCADQQVRVLPPPPRRRRAGQLHPVPLGLLARYRESTVSTWPGDPTRAAKIITDIVRMDEPPLRLLLGAGPVQSARRAPQPVPPKPSSGPTSAEARTSPASQ